MLRNRRIDHLIMTGITTDVCPHDHARGQRLGYEALLLSDCTGATDRTTTSARARWCDEGGVFGALAANDAGLGMLATEG